MWLRVTDRDSLEVHCGLKAQFEMVPAEMQILSHLSPQQVPERFRADLSVPDQSQGIRDGGAGA
jgi:hypothetical protein